jgi:hypothetical protein
MSSVFQLFAHDLDDPLHPARTGTSRFSITEHSIVIDVPPIETSSFKNNPTPSFPLTN